MQLHDMCNLPNRIEQLEDRTDSMEDVLFEKLNEIKSANVDNLKICENEDDLLVVFGSNLTDPSCDLTSV